jgi:hypothetical protein
MSTVSVGLIEYQIISETEAAVQTRLHSLTTLLPRNSVAFRGNRVRVTHLNTRVLSESVNIVVIAYSLHSIFCGDNVKLNQLESLVFELGSELVSIDSSAFQGFSSTSIFIPPSVRFIGSSAFSANKSAGCVHFARGISLGQFKPQTFSCFSHLSVITIPASVRHIHDSAFRGCKRLL